MSNDQVAETHTGSKAQALKAKVIKGNLVVEHGRGAWSTMGVGGTVSADGFKPGPYYALAADEMPFVGSRTDTDDQKAVHYAVVSIQRQLNRRKRKKDPEVKGDGVFGPETMQAVLTFQERMAVKGIGDVTPWGGIGPDSAKMLFTSLLKTVVKDEAKHDLTTPVLICGFVTQESGWDPGAVGYVDPDDHGFAQINAPSHPDVTVREAFQPVTAFGFIVSYFEGLLHRFDDDLDLAVAAYNLGVGGASTWDAAGRPDIFNGRNVRAYVDRIKTVCA